MSFQHPNIVPFETRSKNYSVCSARKRWKARFSKRRGTALLRASIVLDIMGENDDQNAGVSIVRKALQAQVRQIAENAGDEGSIVVGRILESNIDNFGYNAQTGEFGDMIAMGIVDPVKVVRTALQNAASVAGLLVTTEAMIADLPKKDVAGSGMPDMGGMI
jgi:chaperonin GroEL